MSILDNTSKRILVQSMRNVMENAVVDNAAYLSESQIIDAAEFVHENATYEQLLNVAFNPYKDTKYLPAHVLEGAAAILHSACLTGRRVIGVNAITEGAIMLAEKTGCVITESMLDAAYNAAVKGDGLKVIGESFVLSEKAQPKAKTKASATKAPKAAGKFAKFKDSVSNATKVAGTKIKDTGKWFGAADNWKDFSKSKAKVKNTKDLLSAIKPTKKNAAKISDLKGKLSKNRKDMWKNASIASGKNAAALAALAAAGYGIKKIIDWRKNKKKENED